MLFAFFFLRPKLCLEKLSPRNLTRSMQKPKVHVITHTQKEIVLLLGEKAGETCLEE